MIALSFGEHSSFVERATDEIVILLATKVSRHLPAEVGLMLMARKGVVQDVARELNRVCAWGLLVVPHVVNQNTDGVRLSHREARVVSSGNK